MTHNTLVTTHDTHVTATRREMYSYSQLTSETLDVKYWSKCS